MLEVGQLDRLGTAAYKAEPLAPQVFPFESQVAEAEAEEESLLLTLLQVGRTERSGPVVFQLSLMQVPLA